MGIDAQRSGASELPVRAVEVMRAQGATTNLAPRRSQRGPFYFHHGLLEHRPEIAPENRQGDSLRTTHNDHGKTATLLPVAGGLDMSYRRALPAALLFAFMLGAGSARPAYEISFVQAGAARLRVLSTGSGPAIVLLPGQGRPPQDLEPVAALLVARGYRAVLPEPRGMGQSTGPLAGLTLHDLARDIAAVISATGAAPVVLVGHGLGNRIARTVAADRPGLVRAVVLLSASGKVQPAPEIAKALELAAAPDTPPDVRRQAAMTAWFAPGNDPTPWLTGWSQPVREAYRAAAAATPIVDWWTAGRAPVLIVQGLDDVSAPPANGRLLKQELGDRARLVEIPRVAHALPIENPEAVARAVLDYLATLRPAP